MNTLKGKWDVIYGQVTISVPLPILQPPLCGWCSWWWCLCLVLLGKATQMYRHVGRKWQDERVMAMWWQTRKFPGLMMRGGRGRTGQAARKSRIQILRQGQRWTFMTNERNRTLWWTERNHTLVSVSIYVGKKLCLIVLNEQYRDLDPRLIFLDGMW